MASNKFIWVNKNKIIIIIITQLLNCSNNKKKLSNK